MVNTSLSRAVARPDADLLETLMEVVDEDPTNDVALYLLQQQLSLTGITETADTQRAARQPNTSSAHAAVPPPLPPPWHGKALPPPPPPSPHTKAKAPPPPPPPAGSAVTAPSVAQNAPSAERPDGIVGAESDAEQCLNQAFVLRARGDALLKRAQVLARLEKNAGQPGPATQALVDLRTLMRLDTAP